MNDRYTELPARIAATCSILDDLVARLEELMRFRHFKRYYFQFEYDWRKIELLIVLFRESVPMVQRELTDFLTTLRKATEEE